MGGKAGGRRHGWGTSRSENRKGAKQPWSGWCWLATAGHLDLASVPCAEEIVSHQHSHSGGGDGKGMLVMTVPPLLQGCWSVIPHETNGVRFFPRKVEPQASTTSTKPNTEYISGGRRRIVREWPKSETGIGIGGRPGTARCSTSPLCVSLPRFSDQRDPWGCIPPIESPSPCHHGVGGEHCSWHATPFWDSCSYSD